MEERCVLIAMEIWLRVHGNDPVNVRFNDQSHRNVMTWLMNKTGMGSPSPRTVRFVVDEVDTTRRLVLDYLGHLVVIITTTSYLAVSITNIGTTKQVDLTGRKGDGAWIARDHNVPMSDGEAVVVLCDREAYPTGTRAGSQPYIYTITGVMTATSGSVLGSIHTTEQ